MSSASRIIRRLLQGVPALFGLSVLIFYITRVLPGAPVRLAVGPDATPEQVEAVRQEMGLNDPIHEQYINWLVGVFQGDWGMALRTGNPVYYDLSVRIHATLELVLLAILLASLMAIVLGVVSGMNKDRWPDHLARIGALFGVSLPRFWLAILLQIILVVQLGWFPLVGRFPADVPPPAHITGFYLVDSLLTGQIDKFWISLKHILLPALALGTGTLAQITRLIRSNIIEEMRRDYTMNARATGIPEGLIRYKYMLKNAFTAALTVIGLSIGALIGGAFFVEVIFAWPGIAYYGVQAILFRDLNAIIGITIIIGTTYMIANVLVDLLYAWLDPRIRLGENQS